MEPTNPAFLLAQIIPEILGALIAMLYFGLMHARLGKTLGKMACGFRVVQKSGEPITMSQAMWRAFWFGGLGLVPAVIAMPLVFVTSEGALMARLVGTVVVGVFALANIIVALVDQQQMRALHDRLTKTRVVLD